MTAQLSNLTTVDHPLVQHMITTVRNQEAPPHQFRGTVRKIAELLGYEAMRDLPTQLNSVTTPLGAFNLPLLSDANICFVSILRAGNGLLDGLLDLYPQAAVGYIGLSRNEETLKADLYYNKLPPDISKRHVIVCDPMLATGGSASDTLTLVKETNPLSIRLVTLVAAPEGVARINADHPDVDIITGALDSHLNEQGYIVPGLGDAGDRLYGTVG